MQLSCEFAEIPQHSTGIGVLDMGTKDGCIDSELISITDDQLDSHPLRTGAHDCNHLWMHLGINQEFGRVRHFAGTLHTGHALCGGSRLIKQRGI